MMNNDLGDKLIELAFNVLDITHKQEFAYLCHKFGIPRDSLVLQMLDYSLSINSFTNNQYNSHIMRLVLHLHNCITESYHQKRQNIVASLLLSKPFKSVVDIGFGVPARYVFQTLEKIDNSNITLADKQNNALEFAREIIKFRCKKKSNSVKFQVVDMDDFNYVGDYDVYLFLDSIEHCNNPTKFLKLTVKNAPATSRFILSIPICSMESLRIHYYEWLSKISAVKWLEKCGLKVIRSKVAKPVKAVDVFADYIKGGFYNLIVECVKNGAL